MDYGAETRNRLRCGMIEGGFSIEVAVSISARCLQVEDISMVAGFYVPFMIKWYVSFLDFSENNERNAKRGVWLVWLAIGTVLLLIDKRLALLGAAIFGIGLGLGWW